MARELEGRVAVITGGGRGIGEAIGLAYAGSGASLVLASRSSQELDKVAERCRLLGVDCLSCPTDVSDPNAVYKLMQEADRHFGRLDILVNAAGVHGPIGRLTDVDPSAWMKALHINLMGTVYACREAVRLMAQQHRGKIINFSGGGATASLPHLSAYAVSKAAVVRFTETLAEEVRPFGICVNAIAPGTVDTRLQDDVLEAGERAGDHYELVRRLRESGEGATPIELPAELALFLASDASDGLTGRLISAPYDPWQEWDQARIQALDGTPWYTLRRIDPFTIGPLHGKTP